VLNEAVGQTLTELELPYIAEVVTGGDYVPAPGLGVEDHLDDLEQALEQVRAATNPIKVNAMAGSDRWSLRECVRFYGQGQALAETYGVEVLWETHRSRPTYSPWQTVALLQELPELKLTCDFSHWCVVCERLVMDEEPLLLSTMAAHCRHLHLRVGHAQGPQLPDPQTEGKEKELESHWQWWRALVAQGEGLTATPEFGPDGYLQDGAEERDLRKLNRWMAERARERLR
jgi:hypothetical protein